MKLGKLSLVAVMALGTSAYALEDIKVDGEAKLWYQTSEFSGGAATANEKAHGFFDQGVVGDKGASSAQVKLSIGASAKLLQNVSGAVKVTALTTLGLENNLVGMIPSSRFDNTGVDHLGTGALNDQYWAEVANLKYAQKEFDIAAGRMALQTPLCFTESWNVVDNTFEAVVAHAYVLPDTILAAAWVGKHNGAGLLQPTAGRGTTVAFNGEFSTFATDGAYAFAAINKSLPDTTLQAWYYNVPNIADAYWLQADSKLMGIVSVGAQYAGMNPDLATSGPSDRSSDVFALKASGDVAGVNVYAAYSTVGTGTLGFANVATGDKSMVYTSLGSIYMDGEIAANPDTDTWKIGASTKMVPGVTLSASYAQAEVGNNGGTAGAVAGASTLNTDFTAWDIVANTKVGMLDVTAIYTSFDKDVKATNTTDKTTDTLRIIASLKF